MTMAGRCSPVASSSEFNGSLPSFMDESSDRSKNYVLASNNSSSVETTTAASRSWISRRMRLFSMAHPRSYARISRAFLYLRGPRPKVNLPAPSPLLDFQFRIRRYTVSIPLESIIIKTTRPCTSPYLLILLGIAYIIGLAFLSRAHSFLVPEDSFFNCVSTFYLANNRCGLDGRDCFPLNTSSTIQFRCPAQCHNTILQNSRTVGGEQTAFVPLIIGGGDVDRTYRADSFVCAAAEQAGIISGSKGGCGTIQMLGGFTNFLPFSANGLSSIGFPSAFPLAFRFSGETSLTSCTDLRSDALALNVLITCLLFLILRPKPLVLFWSMVCIGFWHVSLFSQPQHPTPQIDEIFGLFLPLLFIAYAFWRISFRYTMPALMNAPLEACVLYLGPFWVGVLNNLTFDRLPLSRLTASDINKRAGGIATLVVMVVVIFCCAVNQVRVIRKTGWLPYYAGWYLLGGLVLLVLALLPSLSLRLHHYIIPMIFLPGTAFPTRLSAIYQGLLLGLFVNGVAAFGFDPIVQSAANLRQDAVAGSLLPSFLTNSTNFNASIPFVDQVLKWEAVPPGDFWIGFSLLIDDVERYVGTAAGFSLASLNASIPHFFRLAYVSDSVKGDFTMPASLWPNGTWVDPLPGPSY